MIRMDDVNPCKMALMRTPDGKRTAGRPKKRFLDTVETDLRTIGVTN
jgi:hypothetical protein